ncbi:hypothetical protein [Altericroceibacterium xinjiangense]|uniref:hypothetical protein n=1 Tax=Altericroceibacterium xinjiangense TaxID=762261 RepID=UPI000F7E0266|nr:hypothetical protein [Altericroceibacterium xinjiangense]
MAMDDNDLDAALARMTAEASACRAGADFHTCVWERVGGMRRAQERNRRALLSLGIFAVALGAGMGTTRASLSAEPVRNSLAIGAELAPSALLDPSR